MLQLLFLFRLHAFDCLLLILILPSSSSYSFFNPIYTTPCKKRFHLCTIFLYNYLFVLYDVLVYTSFSSSFVSIYRARPVPVPLLFLHPLPFPLPFHPPPHSLPSTLSSPPSCAPSTYFSLRPAFLLAPREELERAK